MATPSSLAASVLLDDKDVQTRTDTAEDRCHTSICVHRDTVRKAGCSIHCGATVCTWRASVYIATSI